MLAEEKRERNVVRRKERVALCLLARGFVRCILCALGDSFDRRCTASVYTSSFSPSSSARYPVARRSYEGDRDTTGVTKGSSVVHVHTHTHWALGGRRKRGTGTVVNTGV